MNQKNEITHSDKEQENPSSETFPSQKKIHTAEGWMRQIKQKNSTHRQKEI